MKSRTAFYRALWLGFLVAATAPAAAPAQSTARERCAMEAAFARADTNGDGRLSREEVQRLPAIAAQFDALDEDKDGFLSLDEFAAGAAQVV
jgi:Ca2+-binding EF-hand superfamily protein